MGLPGIQLNVTETASTMSWLSGTAQVTLPAVDITFTEYRQVVLLVLSLCE